MIKNNTLFEIDNAWAQTLKNIDVVVEYANEDMPDDAEAYTEVINGVHHIFLSAMNGADEITINHELIHVFDRVNGLSEAIDFHEYFQCPIAELPNYEVLAYALEELAAEKTIKILTNL